MTRFRRILQTDAFLRIVLTFILTVFLAASGYHVRAANDRFSSADKKLVDNLVKQWAPLVWLAPGEKFLPLDVNEFLDNVHVHHEQPTDPQIEDDIEWELHNTISSRIIYTAQDEEDQEADTNRQRRTSNSFSPNSDLFDQLPSGSSSKRSYLVTNGNIDDLLRNESSFLYGKDPNRFGVPIYAVVNVCSGMKTVVEKKQKDDQKKVHQPPQYQQQFIPISLAGDKVSFSNSPVPVELNKTHHMEVRIKRETDLKSANNSNKEITSEFIANLADNVKFTLDDIEDRVIVNQVDFEKTQTKFPSFHVTYWMFYPYSQGKTMCTMSLGPLGRIPIPLIFGMCMGSKKDFGSHVGDWEHMSLFFKGSLHPDAMYVSAHDAGAYYSYNQLTETFEFRSQETRKGILQRPNFPKTVITSSNHPVLFAAMGSHGLWTAPGKHRFVRVPRLYDVNGFGTPWYTWKIVDITYENLRSQRSLPPKWFRFKGKWGNPKSKCHPLRRIGLNFCEHTDGPTGIPLKQAHFQCSL